MENENDNKKTYFQVYSRELGMYIGNDEYLTEDEEKAKIYDNIGEAMERAAMAMNLGNVFRVFVIEEETDV